MACSCNSGAQWTLTKPNGATQPFRTFNEAQAAQARSGGTIAKTR